MVGFLSMSAMISAHTQTHLIAQIKHVHHLDESHAEQHLPALRGRANDNVEWQCQCKIEEPRARRAVTVKGPDLGGLRGDRRGCKQVRNEATKNRVSEYR
jgi:hypothetical protein